jgi:hypothetical protein
MASLKGSPDKGADRADLYDKCLHFSVTFHACAVCQPPAGVLFQNIQIQLQTGSCTVAVRTRFTNGSSINACPSGGCDCSVPAPIYSVPCGSLVASVYIYLDLAMTLSGPSLDTYLTNLGIGNVNTIYGVVYFQFGSTLPVTWSIDIWRNLEVVRTDPGNAVRFIVGLNGFDLPHNPTTKTCRSFTLGLLFCRCIQLSV